MKLPREWVYHLMNWTYAIIGFLVLGWACFAYDTTTGNLVNQNFTDNSWSGTNQSTRHDNTTIAGVDGKYVETTVTLGNTLSQTQMQGGFSSTIGGDIWFWNNRDQSVVMTHTVGSTTQTRTVGRASGYYNTYTDVIIISPNATTSYDIKVKFDFNESGNSNYHYAADLKNPTLVVSYWDKPVQPEVIEEIEEVIDDIIEWESAFLPPVIAPPVAVVPPVFELEEEFVLQEEPVVIETLEELEEEFEEVEILEVWGGPEIVEEPLEEEPNEPEEVATEIMETEQVVENEPEEATTAKVEETTEEPEVESSLDTPEVAEAEVEEEAPVVEISVQDIQAQVSAKIESVEKSLATTSIVAAQVMTSKQVDLSSYYKSYTDDRKMYEGNDYTDLRILGGLEIYTENNNKFLALSGNDPVLRYQQEIQETRLKRIQLERELQILRR